MGNNDLIIDDIVSFKLCWKCKSCNNEYELVEDNKGVWDFPHYCPNCGFDLHKDRQEEAFKKQQEIENNEYCQLYYDLMTADLDCGIHEHPQTQMKKLGYKVIGGVPQSIADCWWFTVEEFIEPLPKYLSKMKYNYDYWHGHCWKDCEHFKENSSCCFGGSACKKNN